VGSSSAEEEEKISDFVFGGCWVGDYSLPLM